MIKKIFWLCLFSVSLWAQQITVITSTTNQAFIAKQIGKDKVTVEALCKPREDIHFLDVNPVFMTKLYYADIFIETGLGAEPWVLPLLEGARNPKILRNKIGHVDASVGVTALEIPKSISREFGDIHATGNPHYALDPVNSKFIAYNIYKGLSKSFPEEEPIFKENLEKFHQDLRTNLVKWLKKMKPHKGKIKFVSYHRLWSYFAQRFGLTHIGTLEPQPGIAPSSAHLDSIIQQMKSEGCKIILMGNIYPRTAADYVAEKTGAKVIYAPIQSNGNEEVKSYFEIFDYVLDEILETYE